MATVRGSSVQASVRCWGHLVEDRAQQHHGQREAASEGEVVVHEAAVRPHLELKDEEEDDDIL